MVWRSAATTTDHPYPQPDHPFMVGGHLLRSTREDGSTVDELRQAGVGLGDQRQAGRRAHLAEDIVDTVHPQSAVGADDVGTGGSQGNGSRLGRRTQHRPAVVVEGQHGDDRDRPGYFPDGNQGCATLLDIQKRLQTDQVGPGIDQRGSLLAEGGLHLVEGDLAQGLHKLAGGADGSAHVGPAFGLLACDLHGAGIDLCQSPLQAVVGQLETAAAEGVGDDDVGPGLNIITVHRRHHLRHGQVELFRRLPRLQAPFLEHGAHGSVENKHLFPYRFKEWLHCFPFFGMGGAAMAGASPGACSRE